MAALLDVQQAQTLQTLTTDLWFTHRAEERALARLPEAALLAAELISRMPAEQNPIAAVHQDSPFPGADADMLRLAISDTFVHIQLKGSNESLNEQLMKLFSATRLNMATYDFVAMRVIGLGAIANANQATQFFQFKSARRQHSATIDAAVQQLTPFIRTLYRQYGAQRFMTTAGADDSARLVLRRYIHEQRKPQSATSFVAEFVTRYRERLVAMDDEA